MDNKTPQPVRASLRGGGEFNLVNLNREDTDALEAAFASGTSWVRRGEDGRIEVVSALEPLPPPIPDQALVPFWPDPADQPVQMQLFVHKETDTSLAQDPSITIQHLCGYDYTPKGYSEQAALLESYGFECLRSRRDRNGQYWEIWYLPGTWAAKGELRATIEKSAHRNASLRTKDAIAFLRRYARFGTLDVSTQRLAQRIRD